MPVPNTPPSHTVTLHFGEDVLVKNAHEVHALYDGKGITPDSDIISCTTLECAQFVRPRGTGEAVSG